MRLTGALCLLFMFVTGVAAVSDAVSDPIGLFVERLKDPNAVRCPHCGKPIAPGSLHESAETVISTQLQRRLDEKGIAHTGEKGQPRSLNVLIYRFEERRGGNFAVERPASVGFHVHLYDGDTLAKVEIFDETQRPLSENIFRFFTFLRRGGKWITADSLAREGVDAAVDSIFEDTR